MNVYCYVATQGEPEDEEMVEYEDEEMVDGFVL